MEDPWSKDFLALSTIPGQLYKKIIKISNSPGLKIFNGIMTELNKNTGTNLKLENLTEILNDDGQCYFVKNKLYSRQRTERTFKYKFDRVSTNFLWTKNSVTTLQKMLKATETFLWMILKRNSVLNKKKKKQYY